MDVIDAELVGLAEGTTTRKLMIFMAPQEGKSSRISNWFPLWMLNSDPTLRIGIVSYSRDKALRWGRWLRRAIQGRREIGVELMTDSRAVDRFETTEGGSVVCVGIGGGITGEPIDILIIDDPIRGRAEAESQVYREAAWDWWESNGSTRLSARARVVLMMTRWHSDDLAGRLRKHEGNEWRVLRIPVVQHPGKEIRTQDGRSVYHPNGELISVQGRAPGYFHHLKAIRSAYVWRSIYDQDPVAAEGNLFHRNDFKYWKVAERDPGRHDPLRGVRVDLDGQVLYLDDCWRFITVDLAASTKTSADFTVASCWAISNLSGDLILLDRKRSRIEESDHWDLVRPLTDRWACSDVFVERGFIGTTFVVDATKAGIAIQPVDPDKDKLTRALPATYRVRGGKVWFPAVAEWLDEWCDELAEFPQGANDDQVDTLSYAARIATAFWLPPAEPLRANGHVNSPIDREYEASTGNHPNGGIDLNRAEW